MITVGKGCHELLQYVAFAVVADLHGVPEAVPRPDWPRAAASPAFSEVMPAAKKLEHTKLQGDEWQDQVTACSDLRATALIKAVISL